MTSLRAWLMIFVLLCAGRGQSTFAAGNVERGNATDSQAAEYFGQVSVEGIQSSDHSALRVITADFKNPAARSGLRPGDEILALNGHRIFGVREYDYVRDILTRDQSTHLDLIVRRRGQVLQLRIDPLLPLRRGGFTSRDDASYDFITQLTRAGVHFPSELTADLLRMNPRAGLELAQWMIDTPGFRNKNGWLTEFVELRAHLARQQWDAVSDPLEEPPTAFLSQLSAFYRSIARRYASGQLKLDPDAHGVNRDFYFCNYPVPAVTGPDLGEIETTDKDFARVLNQVHANRALGYVSRLSRSSERRYTAARAKVQKDQLDLYTEKVKLSILFPVRHGAWPYRYASTTFNVKEQASCRELIKQLEQRREKRTKDDLIYSYALVAPYYKDAKLNKALEAMRHIREKSPYLAYRAFELVGSAAEDARQRNQKSLALFVEYATENPFQFWLTDSDRPSPFAVYMTRMSRYLNMPGGHAVEGNPGNATFIFFPSLFATLYENHGSGSTQTLREKVDTLDKLIDSDDFSQQRETLIAQTVDVSLPYPSPADLRRLAKLGRDGERSGELLAGLDRMLDECWLISTHDNTVVETLGNEIFRDLLWESPIDPTRGYQFVSAQLDDINWSKPETAEKQLLELASAHGRLAGTLRIAAELQRHDRSEAAQRLRMIALRPCRYFYEYAKPWGESYAYFYPEVAALIGSEGGDHDFAEHLLYEYIESAGETAASPAWLHLARCKYEMNELPAAVTALAKAADAPTPQQIKPIYLFDGQVSYSGNRFRRWLLTRVVEHPDFDAAMRRELAESSLSSQMPQTLSRLNILEK